VERISAQRLIPLLARFQRGPKPLTLERWATEETMKVTTMAFMRVLAIVLAGGANALSGGQSAERALQRFDQNLINAWAANLPRTGGLTPRVDGYLVERRVPLVVVSYYRGQSTVEKREISCATRDSILLWYGTDAVLLWQDGLWFPDREAVHRKFAETGLVR
jgi:hypothetical protein